MSKYEYEEALREDFKKFAEMNYNWAALSTLTGIATVAAHWAMKCKGEETAEARAGPEPVDSYVRESDYFQLVRQHKALSEVVMKLGARVEELAGKKDNIDPYYKSERRLLLVLEACNRSSPELLLAELKAAGYEVKWTGGGET